MRDFICTRPSLAKELIDKGMNPTEITNPWKPQRVAWLFPVCPELIAVVKPFYAAIGKQLPQILTNAMNGGD